MRVTRCQLTMSARVKGLSVLKVPDMVVRFVQRKPSRRVRGLLCRLVSRELSSHFFLNAGISWYA